MVKVSKKSGRKKLSRRIMDEAGSSEKNPQVHGVDDDDDKEEEDDLNRADEDANSKEEDSEDEQRRQRLLKAISSMGGNKNRSMGERSEAAVCVSEFTVSAVESEKVKLSDVIGTIKKSSTGTAQTKNQLINLQRRKRTIERPLSKQERERIQRDVAFQKTASEMSRWQSVITQIHRSEQLVFPLNQEPAAPKPLEKVVTGWKAQSPLEQEVFALLSANKQPVNDAVLTPAEEASVRAMSLEEVRLRRAELQKIRALQSYYEAKARREKKIKSKKYHKVQNKAKRKEFVKQFDEMVKMDPAAALEELKKMELSRMQERMSLKHQNTGKWAKSKAIMAKYDTEARRAMQQQLEVNKELSQKLVPSISEEEEEGAEKEEMLPDFVNDAEVNHDSVNPWMKGKLSEEPTEKEMRIAGAVVGQGAPAVAEEEQVVMETEEEVLLREFDMRRKQHQAHGSDTEPGGFVHHDDDDDDQDEMNKEEELEDKTASKDADSPDEEEEEESVLEFRRISRGKGLKQNQVAHIADCKGHSAELEEGLVRIRSLEDMDLLPPQTPVEPQQPPPTEHVSSTEQQSGKSRKRKRGIELKEVLIKETKVLEVPLAPTVTESEEAVDQRGLIQEAFAGDDVIRDFLREKKKQEDAGKPKRIDLTLPGWGEWGGVGLKPSNRKPRRFQIKAVPPPPRKDQHLPSVIISERRNSSMTPFQVNSLPFPFENHEQFERCISSPLGRTWNTERTVKTITKAKVVTQLGAVIDPMAEEELLKDKKKTKMVSAGRSHLKKTKC